MECHLFNENRTQIIIPNILKFKQITFTSENKTRKVM
jgi:hypothetical protein